MVQIAQIFDYKNKKQTLSDVIKNFDKYCELTKELYEPFIKKEELIKREKQLKTIREIHLDRLIKIYENLITAYSKFAIDNETRKAFLKTNVLYLLDHNSNYSVLKKVLISEYLCLTEAELGVSCEGLQSLPLPPGKKTCKTEPKIKLEDLGHYFSLVKESKELRKILYGQVSFLYNSNWKEFIETWMSCIPNYDRALKNIEGSKHSVIEFMGELIKLPQSFIIKTGKKGLNSLTFEKNLINYINDKLLVKKGFDGDTLGKIPYHESKSVELPRVYLPQIIYFSEHSCGDECLVLEKEEENAKLTDGTLTSKQKKDCLDTITEFLSFIHTTLPPEVSQKGKVDISNFIKSKLENKLLCLTEGTKTKFYDNLIPVLDCLSQEVYVFHKDAILDNFIVHKREGFKNEICDITAVDWEDHGFQPLYFDLANLLEYSDYLSSAEKEEFLKDYIKFYNIHSWKRRLKKLEYNSDFKLSYLNAVIYRSMCLTSAWSKPKRKNLRPRRDYILNRAIECIKTIKEEHNAYYNKYKINYDLLEEVLKETIATLS